MNKLRVVFTVLIMAIAFLAYGQEPVVTKVSSYKTAIGLRAGGPSQLTIKHFTGNSLALEGLIGMWNNGFRTKLLIEPHVSIAKTAGMQFYYGAGPQLSFYGRKYWYNNGRERYYVYGDDQLGLGVSGVIGLEYKIPPVPIAISLDISPSVEFVSDGSIWTGFNPGLGIKFTF